MKWNWWLRATSLATGLSVAVGAWAQDIPATETPGAIVAVLEAKCYPCHGPEKQKHDLRLDSREAALKGGKSGEPAIAPGDAFASALVRRISLPPENEDVMPPAGKPALTPEETVAIIHWINRGAPWVEVAAAPAPASEPAPATPAVAPAKVSFTGQIQPIFEASCYECHGEKRQKGDLRLDSKEGIEQGSEDGPVVVAGKPDDSPIYKLTTLPANHPDIMPAKGDPLTNEQTDLIKQWILEGAVFDAAPAAEVAKAPETPKGPTFEEVLAALAQGVQPAPAESLATLEGWGALALPLDQKSPLLQVDFQRAASGVGDEQLSQLATLANQVTWLNLAGTNVTDDELAQVAKLKNLTKLHLEKTGISDAGLVHLSCLEHLTYLNLYGSKVTDAGVDALAKFPALKEVFLWQTGVTKEGAAKLAEAKPDLAIDLGWEPPAPTNDSTDVAQAKFDEGSCCAKAVAEGKECDHPCCVEARTAGKICEKCNPKAAAAGQAADNAASLKFDEGSCCFKAAAEGKECDHPCCVEARNAGKVCLKCNPKAA